MRIECKIHGGYWHLPLVHLGNTVAVVELPSGETRDLPIVADLRYAENGAESFEAAQERTLIAEYGPRLAGESVAEWVGRSA